MEMVCRLGLWENFGRVLLLLEVNGMKIVAGLFIGRKNRVTFGQKRVMILFCNDQILKTTKIVSRFGQNVSRFYFEKFLA